MIDFKTDSPKSIQNYINGEWVSALSGKTLDTFSPATGEVYARVPDSEEGDVHRAIDAASKAFEVWSITPVTERSKILRKLAQLMHDSREEFAAAESQDTGKPFAVALQTDIPRSIQNLEFFADAITQFSSECHMTDQAAVNYTVRSPLGVVGCISPWNLPLYLLTWKIAPALASGNTVIAKPSEVTPMTAFLFSKICIEAGLPPGVLNIIHGLGHKIGGVVTSDVRVKAISFTGSTRTGLEIAKAVAPQFKKYSLEMGGKNATLVFADADLEAALATTVRSAFFNQGQVCLCGSRIYVQRPIYEKFKKRLIERTLALKVGDPLDSSVDLGAVVSQGHFDKVMSCIEIAKQEGGQILAGGQRVTVSGRCQKGWFIAPTLIEGLELQSRTNQEEIFGPVVTLAPFDTDEQAVALANGTRYGLSASVWTQDVTRAHRISNRLAAGMVWVNCWMLRDLRTPFGGVRESGVGREGGLEVLRFFTEPKNICIKV